jgi:hypothetical protein
MEQKAFDNLARGLALQQLSRRQVLRAAAAGAIAALVPAYFAPQLSADESAQVQTSPKTCDSGALARCKDRCFKEYNRCLTVALLCLFFEDLCAAAFCDRRRQDCEEICDDTPDIGCMGGRSGLHCHSNICCGHERVNGGGKCVCENGTTCGNDLVNPRCCYDCAICLRLGGFPAGTLENPTVEGGTFACMPNPELYIGGHPAAGTNMCKRCENNRVVSTDCGRCASCDPRTGACIEKLRTDCKYCDPETGSYSTCSSDFCCDGICADPKTQSCCPVIEDEAAGTIRLVVCNDRYDKIKGHRCAEQVCEGGHVGCRTRTAQERGGEGCGTTRSNRPEVTETEETTMLPETTVQDETTIPTTPTPPELTEGTSSTEPIP